MSKLLSVVIIGINESRTIEKTVNSIIQQTENIDCEYIYVDSGSVDNTINIVKNFKQFRIFKVKSNYPTASLGRKVGSEFTTGKFILFLDGDMELQKESNLKFCINLLTRRKEIAVISGKLPEIIYNNDDIVKKVNDRYNVKNQLEKMEEPGGYFIVNRDILLKSGNFDHTIKRNEEVELMSRIRKSGYEALRTKELICVHHHHKTGYSNVYTKFKSNYFTDTWKVLWKCIKNHNLYYYFGFKKQAINIIRILLTSLMLIFMITSLINIEFLIIPLIYYFCLFLSKDTLTSVIRKELSSIITLISILFLFVSKDTSYEIEEIYN